MSSVASNVSHAPRVNLDRTGQRQTYTQQVAAAMNWYRRCVMGLLGQINFQSGYFITRAPDYSQMSDARKAQLRVIELAKVKAKAELEQLIKEIEHFQTLPITITDEQKNKLPRRRKKLELEGG